MRVNLQDSLKKKKKKMKKEPATVSGWFRVIFKCNFIAFNRDIESFSGRKKNINWNQSMI